MLKINYVIQNGVSMKSEKEKMLDGEVYDPADMTLIKERARVKTLCQKYNKTSYGEIGTRKSILKEILGKTGDNFTIEPDFYCDYGYNIEIGESFYANHNLVILDCAKVKIGKNAAIGPNCGLYCAVHPTDPVERAKWVETAKPITIGDNVWLGGNVVVLPGVTIGDNTTIGAGSVVTKDIPSNVVAAGNPCKVLKKI